MYLLLAKKTKSQTKTQAVASSNHLTNGVAKVRLWFIYLYRGIQYSLWYSSKKVLHLYHDRLWWFTSST